MQITNAIIWTICISIIVFICILWFIICYIGICKLRRRNGLLKRRQQKLLPVYGANGYGTAYLNGYNVYNGNSFGSSHLKSYPNGYLKPAHHHVSAKKINGYLNGNINGYLNGYLNSGQHGKQQHFIPSGYSSSHSNGNGE